MKTKYSYIIPLVTLCVLISCTEVIDDPVETCTFSESIGNDTNPNTALYQELLDESVALGFPGISCAIYTPEYGWWVGTAGVASIEDQVAMEPCHLHHSASLAKPVVATMIMRLVEEGKLSLDDHISDFLPADMISRIANGNDITIKHLLGHTSGLDNEYFGYLGTIDVANNPDVVTSSAFLLENYIYDRPAQSKPGEEYNYSSAGYHLLGMIIEEASEMSIGDYFEQEIREPLGLTSTYFKSSPGYPDEIPNVVNGYFEVFPGELLNGSDLDMMYAKASTAYLGLLANPYDYARMYREIFRGNIVDPATVELMKSEEHHDFAEIYQSLAFLVVKHFDYGVAYGHGGTLYGVYARVLYFPDTDVTLALHTNLGNYFTSDNTRRFPELIRELVNVMFTGSREGND